MESPLFQFPMLCFWVACGFELCVYVVAEEEEGEEGEEEGEEGVFGGHPPLISSHLCPPVSR